MLPHRCTHMLPGLPAACCRPRRCGPGRGCVTGVSAPLHVPTAIMVAAIVATVAVVAVAIALVAVVVVINARASAGAPPCAHRRAAGGHTHGVSDACPTVTGSGRRIASAAGRGASIKGSGSVWPAWSCRGWVQASGSGSALMGEGASAGAANAAAKCAQLLQHQQAPHVCAPMHTQLEPHTAPADRQGWPALVRAVHSSSAGWVRPMPQGCSMESV
jgi:hypothetical protein